ncbi:MAG: HNH endonuclease [Planctomycetota bacterium]
MLGLVSNTDREWYDFLAGLARSRAKPGAPASLDEVNFWRPKSQNAVRIIERGAPFFLRLKAPTNAIAGWGFFSVWHLVPFNEAWRLFREKNGAPSFETLLRNISRLRGSDPSAPGALPLGCVVLTHVTFLPESRWLPWGAAEGWSRNIVNDCSYSLNEGPGRRLLDLMLRQAAEYGSAGSAIESAAPPGARKPPGGAVGDQDFLPPPDLAPQPFQPLEVDERRWRDRLSPVREGQSSFRLSVLKAYGSRCALTQERVVPVLEAAHIQPYFGQASNHIQNGLLLRADLHKLYDAGLITISPDNYRLKVSERVRAEYSNGHEYYDMEKDGVAVERPKNRAAWPSPDALAWHREVVFK